MPFLYTFPLTPLKSLSVLDDRRLPWKRKNNLIHSAVLLEDDGVFEYPNA